MKSFLALVAQDVINKYGSDMTDVAVVFPNKRAALFFNEELFRAAGNPVWAPTYYTISELFRNYSPLEVADPIKAIVELYETYTRVTGKDETLDHFFDWGKLLISDFDDVDKNMADADKLFANIANIHELDDVSYLTDEQKDTLKRFFSNFNDAHNSKLKELFLALWNKLGTIYQEFRQRLESEGIAYEGMLYRDVIENGRIRPDKKKYIFVGFNLLQKVEFTLFKELKLQGKADFYWDFDRFYCDANNKATINKEAGKYISLYLKELGNAMPTDLYAEAYDNLLKDKHIEFVKAKTENIQARHVTQWLRENGRLQAGKRTAIVMCDETLLLPILYSMPGDADSNYDVNITTGYPLAQTPVASFVSQLLDLQIMGRRSDGSFRFNAVKSTLLHPYSQLAATSAMDCLKRLEEEHNYFPRLSDLTTDAELEQLFTLPQDNTQLMEWLVALLRTVAPRCQSEFYQEAVFNTYKIANRLLALIKSGELAIDRITLQKLLKQMIAGASIPFHGEPAKGIQIMGVLETRNLDFDHLLILSCNEGKMPKGIRDSSFIPYSIRKAYGLTTVDNKVAIYSYYFFRLLQRATDVTILYNTSTENGNRGEMSRFMLQLMVETPFNISRKALQAGQSAIQSASTEVMKTPQMMQKLWQRANSKDYPLSPSALNIYMACPMKFYYNQIVGMREPDDDVKEQLSSRSFGNIFHNTMEELYRDFAGRILPDGSITIGRTLTASLIENIAKHDHVVRTVDRMFQKEMFGDDESRWRKIRYNGLQLISRAVIIKYVERMLALDKQWSPFNIIAAENLVTETIEIETSEGKNKVKVGGRIDRLDLANDSETGAKQIRVVDYKTGSHAISTDISSVGAVFHPSPKERAGSHPDYYFQAMLYSDIVSQSPTTNPHDYPVVPALVFIQKVTAEDFHPVLRINKEPIADIRDYSAEYNLLLKQLLEEIYEPTMPFRKTDDEASCTYCPYIRFCGKTGQ